jgi:hypothetical protein
MLNIIIVEASTSAKPLTKCVSLARDVIFYGGSEFFFFRDGHNSGTCRRCIFSFLVENVFCCFAAAVF